MTPRATSPAVNRPIASVLFGLLLFIFPRSGALSLIWLIGLYAIFFGVLLLLLGFRLRGLRGTTEPGGEARSSVYRWGTPIRSPACRPWELASPSVPVIGCAGGQ